MSAYLSEKSTNMETEPFSSQTSQMRLDIHGNDPPPLPYNLREHKPAIIIAFTIMLLFDCTMQTAVFYPLLYYSGLDNKVVFAISIIPSTWSFVDWARRVYRLSQVSDEYRPLGATSRWTWDFFHISSSLSIPIVTVFFALGSATANQSVISLPLPFLLTFIGFQILLGAAVYTFAPGSPSPVRLSSIPAGSPVRPPVYSIVEDIVAVNGGGGKRYRQAINDRYEASPVFRQLLCEMSWFWGVPAFLLVVVLLVLTGIGSRPGNSTFLQVSYVLNWTLPWAWAATMAVVTIRWVQQRLREEKAGWSSV